MSNPIGWCEDTWNPYIGCDKVSDGCKNCYAIRKAWRLAHNPKTKLFYADTVEKTKGGNINWTGQIVQNLPVFDKPLRIKKPTMFFVDSMGDLFHEALLFEQIDEAFDIMHRCPQHIFQILTKREKHLLAYHEWKLAGNGFKFPEWPLKNVWQGVSVENQEAADKRIPYLLKASAHVRFLSCEPLLGPVDLKNIKGDAGSSYQVIEPVFNCGDSSRLTIDWVIIGGESGPCARPMHPNWVRNLIQQCEGKVPVYFKQWGEYGEGAILSSSDKNYFIVLNDGQFALFSGSAFGARKAEWKNMDPYRMTKVGKHYSGREIDGKTYTEFPKPRPWVTIPIYTHINKRFL